MAAGSSLDLPPTFPRPPLCSPMAGQASDGLPFPAFPPFPPSWEVRQAYLQWWLICFLGAVGAMKAVGLLRHDLSQLAGLVEGVGAIVFLPRWPIIAERLGKGGYERSFRFGCWLVLIGLGIIVSTHKRKSPICWSQALCTLELLRCRSGTSAVGVGSAVYLVGTVLGLVVQYQMAIGPFAAGVGHAKAE
mmetsp:Transcript_41629/g.120742  ORF Transcript_41629/g.120742 Transcript_41629/m.120742 type:complete len:190 (+) Transcript_41629:29-598(+)